MDGVTAMRLAILLDLDQTLVITEAIEPLRRARSWSRIPSQLHLTRVPPGTTEFLSSAGALGQLGIVTTSPRSYAESVIAHHRLGVPVVVAWHDTRRHKPDPQPLLRAAEIMGVAPRDCVHVGDTANDDLAARAAGMGSILVDWSQAGRSNWGSVLDAVARHAADR